MRFNSCIDRNAYAASMRARDYRERSLYREQPAATAYRILADGTRQALPPKIEAAGKARRGKVRGETRKPGVQGRTV